MDIYTQIDNKYESIKEIIRDKSASKILKHFIDEIIELNKTFSKTEQIDILEKRLNLKIKYQTYNSFFRRNVTPKIDETLEY